MKKLISISLLPLCVAIFVVVGNGQTNQESAKPRVASADQEKTGTSALRPVADNREESIAKNNDAAKVSALPKPALTETYRVGIGDILDIRLLNSPNATRSTLFTVVAGGVIDYPAAGGPILVANLTSEEIQDHIARELKRRAVEENARISVGVRQYTSHTVLVTGLVASPGTRVLRREAVPLYVILAESQLRNDAGAVIIMRAGSAGQSLSVNDPAALNTTVVSGDVITVVGRPQEFYYIGGRVNYAGQKSFQSGITLLQAILAAGGTTRTNDDRVEISREGKDGRLVTTKFSLKQIKAGQVEDPKLQTGDRVEVLH